MTFRDRCQINVEAIQSWRVRSCSPRAAKAELILKEGTVLRIVLLVSAAFLASGCLWQVRQRVDQVVCDMADQRYDAAPESGTENKSADSTGASSASNSRSGKKGTLVPDVPTDVQTVAWMESKDDLSDLGQRRVDLNIPPELPGSEAPKVELQGDPATLDAEIDRIYPELPPLPEEPTVQAGPQGKPYTLSDLQSLAAANSPALRQAVADVEAARGALIQAKTYSNPTTGWLFDPANNNSTANTQGLFIDQVIRTGGKQKLGVAAAQKDLDNAELALKRARSDLATAVRNAYFGLLVDKETLVVSRALARFTDDIYRLQTGLMRGALSGPYEPASLRAQAFATRLTYKQAITTYIYDWKGLLATIGVEQLPLTEVAGRVDRLIPYYDYDEVLAYALRYHTDILTAQNAVPKAKFNLKLAQITPLVPDVEMFASMERDKAIFPFGTYSQFSVRFPLTLWDQNKGNILAAQSALVRASEESHRVEVTLTNSLADAYTNYQNNLYAVEYYRKYILPDLVRYYRGVYARRQLDQTLTIGDLVAAQQTLSSNVASYLGVLRTLWTSVVGVADFLQTDDLFQLAKPRALPELPDFSQAPQWPCGHEALAGWCGRRAGAGHPGAVIPSAKAPPAREGTAPSSASPSMRPPAAQGPADPLDPLVERPEDDADDAESSTGPSPATSRRSDQRAVPLNHPRYQDATASTD
jgi:cobalt-zinc-cadmium efflux system outer membrane protein